MTLAEGMRCPSSTTVRREARRQAEGIRKKERKEKQEEKGEEEEESIWMRNQRGGIEESNQNPVPLVSASWGNQEETEEGKATEQQRS